MSYALSVYLVPQALLDRVCGRNDKALLEQAMQTVGNKLADYDRQMDAPDLDNFEIDISHADALREIFSGKYTKGVTGSRYGWAFECLCSFIGERLSNRGFSPCKTEWYETLDERLRSAGVPLRTQDLIFKSPVPIPPRRRLALHRPLARRRPRRRPAAGRAAAAAQGCGGKGGLGHRPRLAPRRREAAGDDHHWVPRVSQCRRASCTSKRLPLTSAAPRGSAV